MDRWCTFFASEREKSTKSFFATEERKEEEASASAAACCFSLEWVTSRFVDTPATYELLSKSLSSSRLMLMLLFSQLLTLYGASSTKSPLALWSTHLQRKTLQVAVLIHPGCWAFLLLFLFLFCASFIRSLEDVHHNWFSFTKMDA